MSQFVLRTCIDSSSYSEPRGWIVLDLRMATAAAAASHKRQTLCRGRCRLHGVVRSTGFAPSALVFIVFDVVVIASPILEGVTCIFRYVDSSAQCCCCCCCCCRETEHGSQNPKTTETLKLLHFIGCSSGYLYVPGTVSPPAYVFWAASRVVSEGLDGCGTCMYCIILSL